MLDLLGGFIQELRAAGLPVSLTENLDAMEAVKHIPIEDRDAFKYALGATLVKNNAHWRAFETVFEVYFSLRGPEFAVDPDGDGDQWGEMQPGQQQAGGPGGAMDQLTPEQLAEMLYRALLNADEAMMRALARQAVSRYAGMEPGRPVGGTYYLYRTLRNLDLDGMLEKLMESARRRGRRRDDRPRGATRARRVRDPHRSAEEGDRGRDPPSPGGRPRCRGDGQDAAQAAARGRRLHARLARRDGCAPASALSRSPASSPCASLASAATVARVRSTSATPCATRCRTAGCRPSRSSAIRRPAKPEIMVVADISGSVAAFARFTLHLVYAISNQFSKVRAFVFIDGIDEVTRFFEGVEDITDAVHRVNTEADVVWVDGHSDYGHALEVFWERWGKEVGPKTTVILLGDARNNYHAAQSWVLKEMRHRARHVYWLNPEPRSYWDTGDSIIGEYGIHTDGVFECRNLRQLERFVENLT